MIKLFFIMRIFIMGYMGAGKSTIGKRLASRLDIPFIDIDEAFETRYRYSIPRFFDQFGEERFRDLEHQCLKDIIEDHEHAVISTGGGTPCFRGNLELMKENGITVYLKMHPSSLASRLKQARRLRPIIMDIHNEDLLAFVESQLKEREPFYERAEIIAKGENFDLDALLEKIPHKN